MKITTKNIYIVGAIVTVAVVLTTIYSLSVVYADTILPNTVAGGVEIGGLSLDEGAAKIAEKIDEFIVAPIIMINGDQTYEFSVEELGVKYDIEKIKNSLPTWGKSSSLMSFFLPREIELSIELDEEKFKNTISIIYTDATAQNAYLYLNPETGEVEIAQESNGQKLDLEDLIRHVENKFATATNEAITFKLDTLYPEVTAEEVEPFKAVAKEIFTRTIMIYYNDENWEFAPVEFANLIRFGTENKVALDGFENPLKIVWRPETALVIELDEEGILKYFSGQIAPEVEIAAQNVVITVGEAGAISFEGTAVDGLELDEQTLKSSLELAMVNAIDSVTATATVIKGGVEVPQELEDKGITELVATGYTNYYGSPYNRQMNIAVGMSKFNGVLVAPDETFSFIGTLGVVDASTGYYKELVITENETRPEYGGGLCQVSSTMFRAILYGGLPIVARTEHSYAVSYYAYPDGYGLDATIYQPRPDLQFTNDTGNYILIQAYTEGSDAYFKFYGTSDGRTVEMDGPYYGNYISAPADVIVYTTELEAGEKQKKDTAHTGFDADWYRTVTYLDGTINEENIHSHYQAWPAKYLVGATEEEISAETSETTTEYE